MSLLAGVLLAGLAAEPVSAIDLHNVLSGYNLASWTELDGLPPGVIWAIEKDKRGYLWLGTDTGLFRFDGLRFAPWGTETTPPLPNGQVRSLLLGSDGALWVGFGGTGGVSRISADGQTSSATVAGLGPGGVAALLQDSQGKIWAATRTGLFWFESARWQAASHGIPASVLFGASSDRDGALLLATGSGAIRRNGSSFESLEPFERVVRHLALDAAGTVWVSDPVVGFRRLSAPPRATANTESGQGSRLLFDARGNLFVGTFGQGLWRVAADSFESPKIEKVSVLTGLTSDAVTSLLADPDGTIWVGTYGGLNRLSPHKITPVLDLDVIRGIEQTPDGSVWVGAVDSLIQFPPGEARPLRRPAPFEGGLPSAMHTDPSGHLWASTYRGGLLRFANGIVSRVRVGENRALRRISSITSDRSGGLWLNDVEKGMFYWRDGTLTPLELPTDLHGITVTGSLVDRSDQLWLAFGDGSVVVVGNGSLVRLDNKRGASDAVYRAIFEDEAGTFWLGGTRGLARVIEGGIFTVRTEPALPTGPIIAIIDDKDGDLWLGLEGAGAVRLDRRDVAQALSTGEYAVRFSYYDRSDGFAGAPRWHGDSSSARSADGRLWFISARGVTVIAPDQLRGRRSNSLPVEVERVVADATRLRHAGHVRVPARTSRLEIDYTVPNLAAPLRSRFKYRLDGFDNGWVDAGTRRQAVYTNLPPRDYVFRVRASDDSGIATGSDATVSFSVMPRFYQERWFAISCVGFLGLVAWGAWLLRIRQVRRQFALLFAERFRLSREIHDTLLQGLFGIGLQCEAIAAELATRDSALQDRLLRVHRDAEEYVRDARSSIVDLRSPQLQSIDLVEALRDAGTRMTMGTVVRFEFVVEGQPYRFPPQAEEQLLRVGQEAVRNAVRHAGARAVHVTASYRPKSITLRIVDDGCGFDPLRQTSAKGHVGITSMRERTEAIRGQFKITSAIGRGTEVRVTVSRAQRRWRI